MSKPLTIIQTQAAQREAGEKADRLIALAQSATDAYAARANLTDRGSIRAYQVGWLEGVIHDLCLEAVLPKPLLTDPAAAAFARNARAFGDPDRPERYVYEAGERRGLQW